MGLGQIFKDWIGNGNPKPKKKKNNKKRLRKYRAGTGYLGKTVDAIDKRKKAMEEAMKE